MTTNPRLALTLMASVFIISSAVAAESIYWAFDRNGDFLEENAWTNATGVVSTPDANNPVINAHTVVVDNVSVKMNGLYVGIAVNSHGFLHVKSGTMTVNNTAGINMGSGNVSCGEIIQDGGDVISNGALNMGTKSTGSRVGYYYMNGGTLRFVKVNVSKPAYRTIYVGGPGKGFFYQRGGEVSALILNLMNSNPGAGPSECLYEMEGGTMGLLGDLKIGNRTDTSKASIVVTPVFRMFGSKGVFTVGGDVSIMDALRVNTRVEALIDNGGLTPVNLTDGGVVGLGGTLVAGVANSVAFTATNSFALFSGASAVTNSFISVPDPTLWTTSVVESTGLSSVCLNLADASCKAEVTAGCHLRADASFDAAAAGHVKVNVQGVGKPMPVRLAVNPGTKTVEDLIDYLKTAGFDAGASDRTGHDVMFTVTPSAAESYLVWDLSAFDSEATVNAVCVGNPQPALSIMIY